MNDIITSRSNPFVIETAKLKDKKFRDETGLFVFEGIKLFKEAVDAHISLTQVFITEEAYDDKLAAAAGTDCAVRIVTDGVYEKMSQEKSPQGIICTAKHLDNFHKRVRIYNNSPYSGKKFIVSSIRDPGNLGTIVRSAAAFGIGELILSEDCADIYNPKTIRAAMGALFRQHVTVCASLTQAASALKNGGYEILAAVPDKKARRLQDIAVNGKTCFAVGNEGHGLDCDFIRECAGCVLIPMCGLTESLNVSAAASVLLWEMLRAENR